VVKLHPKEKHDGLYEEVFGKSTYGKKWGYSNAHPFVLGKNCFFAVSFFTSVTNDMISIGVPIIEYLNLKGIPEYDNKNSLRDSQGEPVFKFRYFGLVLGASNYEQMENHALRIVNNKPEVVAELQSRYNELFPRVDNPNKVIAKDILSALDKR